MSSFSRPASTTTVTIWSGRATGSATETSTYDITPTATIYRWGRVVVSVTKIVELPLTCDSIYNFNATGSYGSEQWRNDGLIPLLPNADIAGLGIIFSFLITAFLVLLLAIAAYVGGFLPGHYSRRVDLTVLHVNSRNENSRWREIFESVMLSFSGQQLVTGLPILVAGYYEMLSSNLSVYHWNIVVYLAWMSSAVHIASLTLLRDVFNKRPALRNIRVAGMLTLLALLTTAMWPLRRFLVPIGTPARCLWGSRPWNVLSESTVDLDWGLSITILFSANIWKLSQLFSSSRGWARRWFVANLKQQRSGLCEELF